MHDYECGPCCKKQSIFNMDYYAGWGTDRRPMVNRVCSRCHAHWAGPLGKVKQYTSKEWDKYLNESPW